MKRFMSVILAVALFGGGAAMLAEPALAGNRSHAKKSTRQKLKNSTKKSNKQKNSAKVSQKAKGGNVSANGGTGGAGGGGGAGGDSGHVMCFTIDSGGNVVGSEVEGNNNFRDQDPGRDREGFRCTTGNGGEGGGGGNGGDASGGFILGAGNAENDADVEVEGGDQENEGDEQENAALDTGNSTAPTQGNDADF